MELPADSPPEIRFTCNLCGQPAVIAVSEFHRELAFCQTCGSVARFRGIVYAISQAIFGNSIVLSEFPQRKDMSAIGLSDAPHYSVGLEKAFNYTNTFYHVDPFYDVTADEPTYRDLDFIVCSDVLEHVAAPVSRAFGNLRRALRPGGTLILSVPYSTAPTTTEHFGTAPSTLRTIEFTPGEWVMLQRDGGGQWKVYDQLIFHGGPGTTVEMRVFGEAHLRQLLVDAGFVDIHVYGEPMLDIGYYWPALYERTDDIKEPILGYVMAARA
jgi:SAM-dependent methyltransferase